MMLCNVVQNVLENEPRPRKICDSTMDPAAHIPDRSYKTAHYRHFGAIHPLYTSLLSGRRFVGTVRGVLQTERDVCCRPPVTTWDETIVIWSFNI